MESKMDKRLEQALEHASYVQTFHNQKRILQQKFIKECTCYYAGGTFIIDPALITFISSQKNEIIVIDSNQIPIELHKDDFYETIVRQYNIATINFHKAYKKLCDTRKVEGLISE